MFLLGDPRQPPLRLARGDMRQLLRGYYCGDALVTGPGYYLMVRYTGSFFYRITRLSCMQCIIKILNHFFKYLQ